MNLSLYNAALMNSSISIENKNFIKDHLMNIHVKFGFNGLYEIETWKVYRWQHMQSDDNSSHDPSIHMI